LTLDREGAFDLAELLEEMVGFHAVTVACDVGGVGTNSFAEACSLAPPIFFPAGIYVIKTIHKTTSLSLELIDSALKHTLQLYFLLSSSKSVACL